jgi:hypothetical protein
MVHSSKATPFWAVNGAAAIARTQTVELDQIAGALPAHNFTVASTVASKKTTPPLCKYSGTA